jgi:hypothetical protein
MKTDDISQERRRGIRKKVKIVFLFKLGRLFNGRGIAKDINENGMCLVCPALFKPRRSLLAKDFIGASLQVMIPSPPVTVTCVIAWVNLKKGEGGIKVALTSDDSQWKELCS